MKTLEVESYTVTIYIAGNYDDAVRACKTHVVKGFCVSIQPTDYAYTGGFESGVAVTLINYPRFPTAPAAIVKEAKMLAVWLMSSLYQESCTIDCPDTTIWLSNRKEDNV